MSNLLNRPDVPEEYIVALAIVGAFFVWYFVTGFAIRALYALSRLLLGMRP